MTGHNTVGCKQYRYHRAWDEIRSLTKFSRLQAFGEKLPALRQQIKHDLASLTLGREQVVALVITLMDQSFICMGNEKYARKNKSYSFAMLYDKYVTFKCDAVRSAFIGKKGVAHDVTLRDRRLVCPVRKCREIPGQYLFQYYTADGHRHTLESGDVNSHLHQHTGLVLSAKDFRTWGGTVKMVECLESALTKEPDLAPEKDIRKAVKDAASGLGNTPTVCSKYYIHP